MESKRDSLKPEVSCCAHKLPEVWNGINHPIKELDVKLPEERDGDPRKKRFQVVVPSKKSQWRLGSVTCVMIGVRNNCLSRLGL
jgi:hypothetical protein